MYGHKVYKIVCVVNNDAVCSKNLIIDQNLLFEKKISIDCSFNKVNHQKLYQDHFKNMNF